MSQSEWTIFGVLLVALFVFEQLGWLRGRHEHVSSDEESRGQVSAILGAVLGMLALLLGFTFSMAAHRFSDRRDLLIDEANAIGTAILRADLVTEPEHQALTDLLTRYVDLRIAFYRAENNDAQRAEIDMRSEQLHAALWRNASAVAARAPTPITALLISALNDAIDLYGKRAAALENHVPAVVMWLLVVVAILAAGLMGYVSGLLFKRQRIPTAIVLVLIAVITIVIVDLDRPQRGLIEVGQSSMLKLQHSVNSRSPQTP